MIEMLMILATPLVSLVWVMSGGMFVPVGWAMVVPYAFSLAGLGLPALGLIVALVVLWIIGRL